MPNRADTWTSVTSRFYAWRAGLGDAPGGVAALIAERPVQIVIRRDSGYLAEQTVRVDLDSGMTAPWRYGRPPSSSLTNAQKIILLGYKGLVDMDDTDLAVGDVFLMDEQQFKITKVEFGFPDRVLAQAEADG